MYIKRALPLFFFTQIPERVFFLLYNKKGVHGGGLLIQLKLACELSCESIISQAFEAVTLKKDVILCKDP